MTSTPLPQLKPITLADISNQAERAIAMMGQIRSAMLAPTARKVAPLYSLSQLAGMVGVEKGSISHRLTKETYPPES